MTEGYGDKQHLQTRINEHEDSRSHKQSSENHATHLAHQDTVSILDSSSSYNANKQISRNIEIVDIIIDVVKLIGKQGMSFRGHRGESAYTFDIPEVNHGNFLEILLTFSKRIESLSHHIARITSLSKVARGRGSKGRGSLVTFM